MCNNIRYGATLDVEQHQVQRTSTSDVDRCGATSDVDRQHQLDVEQHQVQRTSRCESMWSNMWIGDINCGETLDIPYKDEM